MLSCCNEQSSVFDRKIRELRGQLQGLRKQISNASLYKMLEFESREASGCLSIVSIECAVSRAPTLLRGVSRREAVLALIKQQSQSCLLRIW